MQVRDVMTTDLVTVAVDERLQAAVGALLEHGVGSVVVEDEGTPVGLVTAADALAAAHRTGEPLTAIPVRSLTGETLVTTTPDRSVEAAVRQMGEADVKKLPVVEDLDLVGIVTLSDVARHVTDFRDEAEAFADRHEEWRTD